MTLDEFKSEVRSILNKSINDNVYINSLDRDMERTYNESCELADLLGYEDPSPSGYAFGIMMLYPDYPPIFD